MSIGPIGSMINFGHSIYDINGNKYFLKPILKP